MLAFPLPSPRFSLHLLLQVLLLTLPLISVNVLVSAQPITMGGITNKLPSGLEEVDVIIAGGNAQTLFPVTPPPFYFTERLDITRKTAQRSIELHLYI